MTAETIRKAMIATRLNGSSMRREKMGGAKKYARPMTPRSETTADEMKLPCRERQTITVRYRKAAVARLNRAWKQTLGHDPERNAPEKALSDRTPEPMGLVLRHRRI